MVKITDEQIREASEKWLSLPERLEGHCLAELLRWRKLGRDLLNWDDNYADIEEGLSYGFKMAIKTILASIEGKE